MSKIINFVEIKALCFQVVTIVCFVKLLLKKLNKENKSRNIWFLFLFKNNNRLPKYNFIQLRKDISSL